jgi:hypothetical protein
MENEDLDAALVGVIRDGDGWVLTNQADGAPRWTKWSPSTNVEDFAFVKKWIEQKGWAWQSLYEPSTGEYFYTMRNLETGKVGRAVEKTSRIRTGCIALLRALEE